MLSAESLKHGKLRLLRHAHIELQRAEVRRWQLIVDLTDNTGASLAEIGEALGVPRQTARIRIRQAREGLAEHARQEGL